MRWRWVIGGILIVFAEAHANDTTAELATGGLVYVQSSDVAIEEEDLYVSREEIRVDYVFRNTGETDVESVIAFPMPDIPGGSQSDLADGDPESDNFLGFSVVQDGREITPQLQQRVTVLGIDRTEEVAAANVPLLPYSERTSVALKNLPEDVKARWIAEGLIYAERYDAGQGWQEELRPGWTLRSVYWWKTTFPAGKPVRVSHRYKPSVGGTVAMSFIQDGKPAFSYDTYVDRYCLDQPFMKTAAKLEAAAGKSGPHYTEQWLSYILTTGANWAGPIGRFKLTVDKGRPQDYVSFCGEGIKKTGPTTFEMTASDFYPDKDLHVLFLTAAGD